jgi:hypothetical protein
MDKTRGLQFLNAFACRVQPATEIQLCKVMNGGDSRVEKATHDCEVAISKFNREII